MESADSRISDAECFAQARNKNGFLCFASGGLRSDLELNS